MRNRCPNRTSRLLSIRLGHCYIAAFSMPERHLGRSRQPQAECPPQIIIDLPFPMTWPSHCPPSVIFIVTEQGAQIMSVQLPRVHKECLVGSVTFHNPARFLDSLCARRPCVDVEDAGSLVTLLFRDLGFPNSAIRRLGGASHARSAFAGKSRQSRRMPRRTRIIRKRRRRVGTNANRALTSAT